MHRSRDEEALFQALEREGCPVCLVSLDALQRAMENWQYEGFTDAQDRLTVVEARGFCPRHTWQISQLSAAFPLALVYSELLSDMLGALQQEREQLVRQQRATREPFWSRPWRSRNRQSTSNTGAPFSACPFCQRQREIEERFVNVVVSLASTEAFCQQMSQGSGFCLTHLTQVYRASTNDEQRARLLACQHSCMQHLQQELAELVRKHDYRFREEPRGNEMTSWRRAAQLFTGNAGVR